MADIEARGSLCEAFLKSLEAFNVGWEDQPQQGQSPTESDDEENNQDCVAD